jgi:hypothetical protein
MRVVKTGHAAKCVVLIVLLQAGFAFAQNFEYGVQQCSADGNFARISIDSLDPVLCGAGYCQVPDIKADFHDCLTGSAFNGGAIVITGYQFQSQVHQAISEFRIDLSNQVVLVSGTATRIAVSPVVRWLDSSGATDDMAVWLHFEAVAIRKPTLRTKTAPNHCESGADSCESAADMSGVPGVKMWLGVSRFVINSTSMAGWAYADRFSLRGWYDHGSDSVRLSCQLSDSYHFGVSCDSDGIVVTTTTPGYSPYSVSTFGFLSFTQGLTQARNSILLSASFPILQSASVSTCGTEGFGFNPARFPSTSKAYMLWAGAHAKSCEQSSATTFKFQATGALGTYTLPGPPDTLYDLGGIDAVDYTVKLAPIRAR